MTDLRRGVVVHYDPAKGFGFLRPAGPGADVFVHASAIDGGGPLRRGQRVTFSAVDDPRGPRASRVEPGRRGLAGGDVAAGLLALVTIAVIALLRHYRWGWAWAWLAAINGPTFAAYAWDKRRAGLGLRRVPEAVLLGLALVGGSPGAALAMLAFHHKTRKLSFLLPFAAIVALQVALGLWWSGRR